MWSITAIVAAPLSEALAGFFAWPSAAAPDAAIRNALAINAYPRVMFYRLPGEFRLNSAYSAPAHGEDAPSCGFHPKPTQPRVAVPLLLLGAVLIHHHAGGVPLAILLDHHAKHIEHTIQAVALGIMAFQRGVIGENRDI